MGETDEPLPGDPLPDEPLRGDPLPGDPGSEEAVVLADGQTIFVRPIRPTDRPLFLEGMKHLSPRTWLYRFLAPRDHLEAAELEYLTHPDGTTHFALGACTRDGAGREGPVAVARYARLPQRPDTAECAILVVDAFQGRGVGRLMGERLMETARARGVESFHCVVLLENERMTHLIRSLAPAAQSHVDGSHLVFRVPLGSAGDAS
ncbi:MAG: N-acetyltransferase family protein [Planctomycetota bacterium]